MAGCLCGAVVLTIIVAVATSLSGRIFVGQRRAGYGEDLSIFTRQLSHMLRMKLPPQECIFHLLREYSKSGKIAKLAMLSALKTTMKHLDEGLSLSQSFARQPAVFPQFYVWLVNVGETSERLPDILIKTADFMEQNRRTVLKYWELCIYPFLILFFLFVIATFVTTYIMPTFVSLYEGMEMELPVVTKLMISVIKGVGNPYVIIPAILIIPAIIVVFMMLRFNPLDFLALYLPFYSRLTRYREYATFSSIMGILLGGNVPLGEALELASTTIRNSLLRGSIQKGLREKYTSLSTMLRQNRLMDKSFVWMVTMGEKTETLDEVLLELGKFYSDEARLMSDRIFGWLAPSTVAATGLCVATVIFAVFLPLIKLITDMIDYNLP